MDLQCVTLIGAVLGLSSGASVFPNKNLAVGENALFLTSVGLQEPPLTSIIWRFGPKEILSYGPRNATAPEYVDRIQLVIRNGALLLKNLTTSDTGEYNVTIIKAEGEEITEVAPLKVWEVISNAEVTSSTQLTLEGTPLNITCDSSGFISTRQWLKNGLPLNSTENILFYKENQVLSFKALSRKDDGRYSCIISNPVSSQEATYYMVVSYGQENVIISGPNEVQVTTAFKLSCSAESIPTASYIWMKNETIVAESSEFIKTTSESSDSGEYVCYATNAITMNTSEASHKVLITEAPKDTLSPGAFAGIIIACVVGVLGAAVGGFFIHKHCKKQDKTRANRPIPTTTIINNPPNIPRMNNPPNIPRMNNPPNIPRMNNPPNIPRMNNPPNFPRLHNPPNAARPGNFYENKRSPFHENFQRHYDMDL